MAVRSLTPRALFTVACVAVLAASAATGAFGVFTASTNAVHPASTLTVPVPTSPSCKWAGMADVDLNWTAGASGDGTDVLRSTTQGSGHASIGTATPLNNTSYNDTTVNPITALPQEYFYVLKTMMGTWRSAATAELRTSTCPGYLTTHTGSSGTHATTPTNVAMQPTRITISGTTMYVSDENNVVRAINMSTGAVSVVAGTAGAGFFGDGGRGDLANVNRPYGVAVDSAGNRYIGDHVNHRIRKVTSGGTISTFAGTGAANSLPAAGCVSTGDACGDGGQATAAIVVGPRGVVVDSADNVLFVDTEICRVRRISASTGVITTVAGVTAADTNVCGFTDATPATSGNLTYAFDLALDASGNMYIADKDNKRIRKVSTGAGDSIVDGDADEALTTVAGTGAISAYAGDGAAAASAELSGPSSVFVSSGGTVFAPDPPENRIRQVSAGNAATYAGLGLAGYTGDYSHINWGRLNGPRYMAEDTDGNIYIADTANHCVRVIYVTGFWTNSFGTYAGTCTQSGNTGDGGLATAAKLSSPRGLVIDDEDSLYIADTGNNKVRKVTRTGQMSTFAGTGTAGNTGDAGAATSALLSGPYDIAWDTTNNGRLLIADTGNNRIRRVATTSGNEPGNITNIAGSSAGTAGSTGDGGTATSALLSGPRGVHWVDNSNIYIADTTNNRVRTFAAAGQINAFAGNGTVCAAPTNACGDGSTATSANLNAPEDVAGSTTIYIADTGDKRVRSVASGNIAAYLGDGNAPAFGGDGGNATAAQLNTPVGITVSGPDVYVADSTDNRVRKFSVGGTISTFAGHHPYDTTIGDGGAATSARVLSPYDVAVSGSDVYIAEYGDSRVRKVTGGNISTYAGNGTPAYTGDAGLPTSAQLNASTGIAINAADRYVYISDPVSHKVRYVDNWPDGDPAVPNTPAINGLVNSTGATAQVVGDGGGATSAAMSNPSDMARDSEGNVYVVEKTNHRVRMVAITGEVSTVAGTSVAGNSGNGGLATVAQLSSPDGIAVNSADDVYIADSGNHCVRKLTVSTGVITAYAGTCGTSGYAGDTGAATSATLDNPTGLLFDENGNFDIADTGNNKIRRVVVGTGVISTFAGSATNVAGTTGDGGAATSALLSAPRDLSRDPTGNYTYIADTGNNRIRRVSAGGTISAYACSGTAGNTDHATPTTGTCNAPRGVAWDDVNNDLFIADTGNNRIRRVNGGNLENVAGDTSGNPGASGYAGDNATSGTSSRFNAPEDVLLKFWTGEVATSGWTEVFVADAGNHRVRRIDFASLYLTTFAGTGSAGSYAGDGGVYTAATITSPAGMAVNSDSRLFIADQGDRRVRMTTSALAGFGFATAAGNSVTCSPTTATCGDAGKAVNAQFADPVDVAFDASGNMYVADMAGGRIRKVATGAGDSLVDGDSDELISTIAGTGTASSTGDAGAASAATLNYPAGVFVYDYDLYIVERAGNRVRKVEAGGNNIIEPADIISTVAGTGTASSTGDGGAATSATINAPTDIVFDASGNYYIAERVGCRVRKVSSGTINKIYGGTCGAAGDQGGAPGAYGHPTALAVDSTGNLYVAEGSAYDATYPAGHRIRKIYEADSWTP